MTTGRRASDWLPAPTRNTADNGDERRGDRRALDRRAPRRRIDTLFAASLINQVSPQDEQQPTAPYAKGKIVRAGLISDTRA